LKHLVKSCLPGYAAEGRRTFCHARCRKAEGKQFLLKPGADGAELTRGAIESLHGVGLMLFQIL
jgi:hypothetical protein